MQKCWPPWYLVCLDRTFQEFGLTRQFSLPSLTCLYLQALEHEISRAPHQDEAAHNHNQCGYLEVRGDIFCPRL